MLPPERQRKIIYELTINGRILVSELVKICRVSSETIRRDLSILERNGIIERCHGGAVIAQQRINNFNAVKKNDEPGISFHHRLIEYENEKVNIARRALKYISPGDSILLDSSTTCWYLARQLPDIEITVFTNSLPIVQTLAARGNIRTICLGGEYSERDQDFRGVLTEKPLKEFSINKIFFSCSSLSQDGYLRDYDENRSHLKQQMLLASEKKHLLIDSSKFFRPSFANICHFREVDFLITDALKDKELQQELAWNGVNVIDCSERQKSMRFFK